MTINTVSVDLVSITASEDKALTNGTVCSELGGTIYLGNLDAASSYYEISEEEYLAIMAEQNKDLGDTTL